MFLLEGLADGVGVPIDVDGELAGESLGGGGIGGEEGRGGEPPPRAGDGVDVDWSDVAGFVFSAELHGANEGVDLPADSGGAGAGYEAGEGAAGEGEEDEG